MCDSIPVLCISGQVATGAIGTDAFQECDAIGISRPVTKWNAQIRRTEDVAGVVSKAYRLTTSGRPGPVLLDFPKDMQIGLVPEPAVTESPEAAAGIETASHAAETAVKRAAALISKANSHVFSGGGRLIHSAVDAFHVCTRLVRALATPFPL